MPHCAETVPNRARRGWVMGAQAATGVQAFADEQGLADEGPRAEEPAGCLWAYCRARSTRVRVAVLDISTTGCLLDLRTWGLKAGERVLIKLPGLAYLPAILHWAEDGRGGLVFDQPLHEAVLRHLLDARASRAPSCAAG